MTADQNPYASPAILNDTSPKLTAAELRPAVAVAPFLSPKSRANITVVFLALSILTNIAVLGTICLTQSLLHKHLNGIQLTQAEIDADTIRLRVTAGALIIARLIAVISFMFWTYRVAQNLPALGTERPEFTPGWAVGVYFVPIINLFRPYQAMVEIWNGSDPQYLNSQEKKPKAVSLLSGWWGVYLAATFIGRVLQQGGSGEQSVEQLLSHNYMIIAVIFLLEIPRDILSIFVVRSVTASQESRQEAIVGGPPAPAEFVNPFAARDTF